MRRISIVIGSFMLIAIFGVSILWYWLIPHNSALVRRAEKGDVQAMYEVGMAHLSTSGYGVIDPRSPRNPVLWLRKAAENGHVGAMWELAGIGIPNEEKVMWLKKGADLGSGACMTELANGYFNQSYGLPKDIGAYIYWEVKRSAIDMKSFGLSQVEIQQRLRVAEENLCNQLDYHGQIRPLP